MTYEEEVKRILLPKSVTGRLKARESSTVEFKEAFNLSNSPKYAKTMAAFANNKGGYIIFGIKDKPREIIGLRNANFDDFDQEQLTEFLNTLFSPEIEWDSGLLALSSEPTTPKSQELQENTPKRIGWIYTHQSTSKPIIAQKAQSSAKINSGDIFFRYHARTQRAGSTEIYKIIDERLRQDRERLLKLFDVIQKSDTTKLGIFDFDRGKMTTPGGVDIAIDRKLISKVLKKAKFIKEGSFNETTGAPVIKVTGEISVDQEVEVPDIDPDSGYPYIQKELASKLGIRPHALYVLIWHFKMKQKRKFHIEVTTSRNSSVHKFSELALQFLSKEVSKLQSNPEKFKEICEQYNIYNSSRRTKR